MRRNLDQVLRENHLTKNVQVIPESWPSFTTLSAEVVLASFVIQFAPDPKAIYSAHGKGRQEPMYSRCACRSDVCLNSRLVATISYGTRPAAYAGLFRPLSTVAAHGDYGQRAGRRRDAKPAIQGP
jgi:hypothetical protein